MFNFNNWCVSFTPQVTFKTPSPSVSPGSCQSAEDGQVVKSNKTSAWQQPKQQQNHVLQPLPQPPPQTLTVPYPYQNQQTPQHNLIQQHNQVPRGQVSQAQSVFDNGEMTCQNGLMGALHHHSQPISTNGSSVSSSYGSQMSSFPSHPAQIPFHQLPPHSSPGANLPMSDNPSSNIGNGYTSSHQSYGMKLRQPPFAPWQEESPPLPPSWWCDRQGMTRQSSGGSSQQDETVTSQAPGTQMNLSLPTLNYLQGSNILQQPLQRISMKSPTDLVPDDLYSNANWHSRHQMSAPPPQPLNLNLNLQHQLMSGTSAQLPSSFTPPAATQTSISRSLLQNSSGFQGSQNRADVNQLSVFGISGNQKTQRPNAEVSSCSLFHMY